MKYRKKEVIDAMQFTGTPENIAELSEFMQRNLTISYADPKNPQIHIITREGVMAANIGDYIIKGVQCEFYPCKEDIFKATYDEIPAEEWDEIIKMWEEENEQEENQNRVSEEEINHQEVREPSGEKKSL